MGMNARLVPHHKMYVPYLILSINTGEIMTTKKSVLVRITQISKSPLVKYILHSQKHPVAIATDLPRVLSGVSSTGSKNGIPSKPIPAKVLNANKPTAAT